MADIASNPLILNIDFGGNVTCTSHAAYYQRVTISYQIRGESYSTIFSGTGEDVPMTDSDGQTTYELVSYRTGYSISCLFEYSTNGETGPFSKAVVQEPIIVQNGDTTTITVTSEDSTDHDDNDVVMVVKYGPDDK